MRPGASLNEGQPLADRWCVAHVALLPSNNGPSRGFGVGSIYFFFVFLKSVVNLNDGSRIGEVSLDGASRRVCKTQMERNWRNLEYVRCSCMSTNEKCFIIAWQKLNSFQQGKSNVNKNLWQWRWKSTPKVTYEPEGVCRKSFVLKHARTLNIKHVHI